MKNKSLLQTVRFAVVILLAFCSISTHAQVGQLFTVISVNSGDLTTEQQARLNKIQQEISVISVQFVQVAFIKDIQQGGEISLQMPGKSCAAQMKAQHIESYSNGDYYWYGEVQKEDGDTEEECSCFDGSLTIMSQSGRIFGAVRIDEDIWGIHDMGEGKRVLVKRDYSIEGLGCASKETESSSQNGQLAQDRAECNCPVRVLALYTPNMVAYAADIEDRIQLEIANTKQALKNSFVDECDLNIILEDVQEFEFAESQNAYFDLDSLIANADLQQLREDANADIVAVYTAGDYGSIAGIAYRGPDSAEVVCIVNYVGTSNYTTPHEIGHLFGCRHQKASDPDGTFEHGYDFKTGCWPFRKKRETLLVATSSDCRILHYSNPNVKYKGKTTGSEEVENNARQIRTNGCTVATFMEDDVYSSYRVTIHGFSTGCPCWSVPLGAESTGGAPGNPQYQWDTSSDGFTWGAPSGTGIGFEVDLPCVANSGVYVRLIGTSPDGQTDVSFRYIKTVPSTPDNPSGPCDRESKNTDNGGLLSSSLLRLVPNPATEDVTLVFNIAVSSKVELGLNNAVGKTLLQEQFWAEEGQGQKTLNISSLPPGIYFLQVKIADRTISQKLVKH